MGGSFSETWGSRTGANSRGNSGYYIYIYFFLIFIYLFLDVLGLCCYVWVFSSCSELGLLSSYSAQAFCSSGFSCCRAWAVGTWASVVVVHGLSQFCSVTQLCPTLCNPMDCSTPGFLVHHQPLELAQTH